MRKSFFAVIMLVILTAVVAAACSKTENKQAAPVQPIKAEEAATENPFDATLVEAFSKGENADYLAGSHLKQGFTCTDCHGETAVLTDNMKEVNTTCENCHGGLHAMAELSKENYPDKEINAHESHLTSISCTTCHSAHTQSFPYCLNCHTFSDMQIPFQSSVKPVFQADNFNVYDNVTPNRIDKTDIVVIGSGGAGFSAALNAMENGAKVILLEKMPIIGGNSQLAAGGMNVAGTKYQQAQGITQDTPDIHFADTMKGGRNINDPKLVRYLVDHTDDSLAWIESLGGSLPNLSFSGGQTYKRVHTAKGGTIVGAYLISTFYKKAQEMGMDIRLNSQAVKLLTDESGKVTGVRVHAKHSGIYDIQAKAVILTTGGFGANNALVGKYRPELIGTTTSNQPGALGDGLVLAENIGADFTDIHEIQIHPTVALNTKILISESVRGKGAILINKEGKRFVNEMLTRDNTSAAVLKQSGRSAFVVFDEALYKGWGQIEGYFKLGLVKEGNTPKELAEKIGIPADTFTKTIERYNTFIKNKKDEDFGRRDMEKSLTGKLYAIEIAPGIHHTMGGVKINPQTQVISVDGKPIPGLYAAGEIVGGVHGGNRLGGNAIADIVTFGSLAGKEAAKYIK